MKSHTVHSFDKELEGIRDRVMAMGGLTEQQLSDALTALITGDSFLAEMVIDKDKKLNRMELDIDNACIFLLARRTPVAFDLRLVVTMLKTINDLERIGDLAKEIARTVPIFSENTNNSNCLPLIENIGERVKKTLHKSLDILARSDTRMAAKLYKDSQEDHRHDTILRHMLTLVMEEPYDAPNALHICQITRALERIGDRCRNIAEYVVYLVEGKDIRHAGSKRNSTFHSTRK
uniref:Phosphate-specific transport system accessory protein PhoU n=1 Tax=Candidatus Kentrum sp. TC TaxID=2126339 RepID=A0A451ADC7_9GAMM|nr:MAG: phosphate transport system protein [Candidatus Kentron sp. TC]VFK50879.1 MAG: phosphate uptake regulator, PhoU [Candidatus Kentron sp. TC]VFK63984.1 MAG: phosphate transport system protein [Candidatus Kentron sp. TC]